MTCSQAECERPVVARGICQKHYSALHARGALPDALLPSRKRPLIERVRARLVTDGDCLVWTGHVDRNGYGKATEDGKSQWVHRVVWEDEHGAIPGGLTVDHLCRRSLCCNTQHMELVTRAENARREADANRPDSCPAGHSFTAENRAPNGEGRTRCRLCRISSEVQQ